jgi:hypothetical protein
MIHSKMYRSGERVKKWPMSISKAILLIWSRPVLGSLRCTGPFLPPIFPRLNHSCRRVKRGGAIVARKGKIQRNRHIPLSGILGHLGPNPYGSPDDRAMDGWMLSTRNGYFGSGKADYQKGRAMLTPPSANEVFCIRLRLLEPSVCQPDQQGRSRGGPALPVLEQVHHLMT